MGIVHRAWDAETRRWLAVKRPAQSPSTPDSLRAQLELDASIAREYGVLSRLDHAGVVRAHGVGIAGSGDPYVVIDLIEPARTIVEYAEEVPAHRGEILVQLFDAVSYLHDSGVVHGDLKPENVLVSTSGGGAEVQRAPQVRIIDFGLARASGCGDRSPQESQPPAGSALYLAPELWWGAPPSEASDCYAVGLIAIELLTGVHPLRFARGLPGLAALRDAPRRWVREWRDTRGLPSGYAEWLEDMVASNPGQRRMRIQIGA
jgi:serine/threonine-protein kinase